MTIAELRALAYPAYLQTPEWKARRARAIERAGGRCETRLCGSPEHLEVHHKTYERLGCEADADLVVLCISCHSRLHDKPMNERPGGVQFERERQWKRHFWTHGLSPNSMRDYPAVPCAVCWTDTNLRCSCGIAVCSLCRCPECEQ